MNKSEKSAASAETNNTQSDGWPPEDKNKIKWIIQVLALPQEQQKNLFSTKENVFNELFIIWQNSYSFIIENRLSREPVILTECENKLLIKLDQALTHTKSINNSEFSQEWREVRKLASKFLISMGWENIIPSKDEVIFYPWMRSELISYLDGLADEAYQYEAWVVNNMQEKHSDKYPAPFHDEFDYYVHFLYDDTELATDPNSLISWILKNTEEAKAISKLIQQLENIFALYGLDLSDKEYIEKPEWKQVVKAAQNALKVFNA